MHSEARFFANNDGSFLHYCEPPMTPDTFVYEAVGRFIGTQVDAVVCHMFGFGSATPMYPTNVPEAKGLDYEQVDYVSNWRTQQILKRLWAQGLDPWKEAVEALHAVDMQFWAGMRFCDIHSTSFEWVNEFAENHPEYRMREKCPSERHTPDRPCNGFNYSIPEVRSHRLALIEEVCSRYDIDGFELDFNRHPGHAFPDIEKGRPILTDYMRQVTKLLQDIGDKRGRPVAFAIRTPDTLKRCHEIGLELKTWIEEDLLDIITPSTHWGTVTDIPFHEFIDLTQDMNCRIYGCISEEVGPGDDRPTSADALRATACNAWRQGIDGVYLFNFHHPTMHEIDDSEVLSQLGNPDTLRFKNKQYAVGPSKIKPRMNDPQKVKGAGVDRLPVILRPQAEGAGHTFGFSVGDDLATASAMGILDSVQLQLAVVNLTVEDRFEFKLNGKLLPEKPHRRIIPFHFRVPNHASFHGNYMLEYDLRVGDWVNQGENTVELVLRHRNPMISPDFIVYDMRLDIKYRILPIRG